MKKRYIFIHLLLLVAILTGCSSDDRNAVQLLEPAGVRISSATVERATVYNMTVYAAEAVPEEEELCFSIDGKFEQYLVKPGDWVEEGQVLAMLETEDCQQKMDRLEQQLSDTTRLGNNSDCETTAQIEILKLQLEQMRAEGASTYDCGLKELEISTLQLQLKQTREKRNVELNNLRQSIEKQRLIIENSKLYAPISGRVSYLRELSNGNSVSKSMVVICLADETKLNLQTDYFPESDLKDASRVYAKILDQEYDVQYLPFDTGEYISMVLSGKQMKIQFSVDAPEGALESGQSAQIIALHDYREDVLTIPINALYRDRMGRHVYKLVDGNWVRCPVTIGVITQTKVEILEGLSEGDVVRGSD